MPKANNRKREGGGGKLPGSGSSKKSKDSSTVMNQEELLDQLKCPICFELPKAEVYQCSNGHSVCSQCVVKMKNCPTCAAPYQTGNGPLIRNRYAEGILSTMRFDCPWKDQGCDLEGLTRQQLTEHEEQCPFNPNPVKLCELLFWGNCPFEVPRDFLRNPTLELPTGWLDHIRAQNINYISPIAPGTLSTLRHLHPQMDTLFQDYLAILRGPLFHLMDQGSPNPVGLFMIWCSNHASSSDPKQVSWYVVRVTDTPKSCSVKVKFTLKGRRTAEDDIETSWNGQIIGVREFYKFKDSAQERDKIRVTIPASHLRKLYLGDDGGLDLDYEFTVTPLPNKKLR